MRRRSGNSRSDNSRSGKSRSRGSRSSDLYSGHSRSNDQPSTNTSADISNRIIEHLRNEQYRPQRMRKLASEMGVDWAEYSAFRMAVKALMRAGRVVLGGNNQLMIPTSSGLIIGRYRGHERGFGFLIPDSPTEHGDLFIPPGASLNAITGDTVAARITRRGKRGDSNRVEGEIVEIVRRGQSRFVGELARDGKQWIVQPDGTALHQPIYVGDVSATRARVGDQVVVEITQFPEEFVRARGVIVEVLGRRGDPGVDTLGIMRQYQLPEQFSEAVLEDARQAVHTFDLEQALRNREDCRGEIIVTIDPDDARDFDDAISLRTIRGGGFELGVHIADVSQFVRANSPLDEEAHSRANSVYLPQKVVPMLPEILSNGLCSLQEGEPRLCKSAFISYDKSGRRKEARFANTVIQSTKRLTYRQADRILNGNDDDIRNCPSDAVELLQRMEKLARLIQKRRLAQGMVVLDLPEVELKMNDDGEVTDVQPADTSFPHTIIEMFMVEANEVTAELLTKLNLPHLRRVHPEPPTESHAKLIRFLSVLGKKIPDRPERSDLIRLLASVKGKPESFAVNLAVLRSMAPAEYSPRLVGHFALASEAYSHFTSPIRRYPDLLIHRLIDLHLTGQLRTAKQRNSVPSFETLIRIGKHCSYNEQRAEDAERELRTIKLLQFLSHRLGEFENGVVTGVTNVGLFVQLQRYLIDGLVRFDSMIDDWWDLDHRGGCIVGQRSGRRIKIGDPLRVQIAAVDVPNRQLELAMVNVDEDVDADEEAVEEKPSSPRQGRKTLARGKRRQPRGRR
ncbi:MAG: ribonuclease R [Phycisphaerae bacterium]|nr:ribonuclease R [Phycisphaerae bacterium]